MESRISHAFIFARGGSKGLPGKNLMSLNGGLNLLERSLDLALQSDLISSIFVSTDCNDIAVCAKNFDDRVKLIDRPAALATDDANELEAWKHAVDFVLQNYGEFDCLVSLPCTSPFTVVRDISMGLSIFYENSARCGVVCVTQMSEHPAFNIVKMGEDKTVTLYETRLHRPSRRQDVEQIYRITTNAYFYPPRQVLELADIFDMELKCLEVPPVRSLDIDTADDFLFAEYLDQSSKVGSH